MIGNGREGKMNNGKEEKTEKMFSKVSEGGKGEGGTY